MGGAGRLQKTSKMQGQGRGGGGRVLNPGPFRDPLGGGWRTTGGGSTAQCCVCAKSTAHPHPSPLQGTGVRHCCSRHPQGHPAGAAPQPRRGRGLGLAVPTQGGLPQSRSVEWWWCDPPNGGGKSGGPLGPGVALAAEGGGSTPQQRHGQASMEET